MVKRSLSVYAIRGSYHNTSYEISATASVRRAFSLVELMIVVAILGILAAIVVPQVSNHVQKAKESAAKEDLRVLRETIERYAAEHKDVAPGYPNNNHSFPPTTKIFSQQLIPKYLQKMPTNPFNGKDTPLIIADATPFPAEATQTNLGGWLYKPATKTIKLNWPGTDSAGIPYLNY